ncbi:hypothetical protein AZF37_07565 [endosymbiont 'TC1' of Trimyema compressum]|uniref:hypothetical protein n=1 Tax=endosymbiont 'TC1' of Trimyema compressum TaxID=243899 RepID=UPI0007F04CC2|nr:hypothetical protein [endosymbiont 'TC1' of Trimyema compressum]AMP21038.1 hypothetical protein AZF37_07565 [endosymbiont 'TC1' of Trimyema compressum]
MGINVIGWKYGMCILSSMMASVAGAIISLSFMNCFVDNMSGGRGYMAVACVILGQWTPLGTTLGGGFNIWSRRNALQMRMQAFGIPISSNLLLVFPMIFALIVALIVRGSASARPSALAKPYFKE